MRSRVGLLAIKSPPYKNNITKREKLMTNNQKPIKHFCCVANVANCSGSDTQANSVELLVVIVIDNIMCGCVV